MNGESKTERTKRLILALSSYAMLTLLAVARLDGNLRLAVVGVLVVLALLTFVRFRYETRV